jgi:hypothetical protein
MVARFKLQRCIDSEKVENMQDPISNGEQAYSNKTAGSNQIPNSPSQTMRS